MKEVEYSVAVTKSGEQIPIKTSASVRVQIIIPGDPMKQLIPLDISEKEFEKLRKQAVTNKIPADILSSKEDKN